MRVNRAQVELRMEVQMKRLDRDNIATHSLVHRKYGGTSCVLQFQGSWFLLVTGGPTKDKPTVTFAPPADPNTVTHELTLRVPDCHAAYETLKARGAVLPPSTGRLGRRDSLLFP